MPFKTIRKEYKVLFVTPWMILGAVAILSTVLVVLAVQNINREKGYMARILREKGAALISALEAGARTGMMEMMWGGTQIQNLLEETARHTGILYLVVTDNTGLILAHSDKSRIGQKFIDGPSIKTLSSDIQEHWRLRDYGNDKRSFEVYRFFRPLANSAFKMHGSEVMHGMMGKNNDWWHPSNLDRNRKIIFVGLDLEPFEAARKEDVRNTIIISSVLLVLGFGGFFSMFLTQKYRITRRLLQDTSAFAAEMVTNLPVGLMATARGGKIAFFNEAAERITGLSFQDLRGKDPEKVLPTRLCGLKAFLDQGQTILEQEMECVFADGGIVPLSVSATQIINEEGYFVGNMLILRDLGEVRRLQEEVRRKEKLAALGGLAAGIAHEIRNPLSSIKGLASFFRDKFAQGSDDWEAAAVMVREVDRLNRVISELLEFAGPSALKLKPNDVNKVLEHSVRLVRQDAVTKKIDIDLSMEGNLPLGILDPDRFSQCLLNLYLNAIQAMDEGGVLSVKAFPANHGSIKIEIADTGKGISPDDLNNIFNPYFTTKPSGTGLGLAIVHKIIEGHEGRIKVTSTPGKGTVFAIFIPGQINKSNKRGHDESG